MKDNSETTDKMYMFLQSKEQITLNSQNVNKIACCP